MKREEEQLMPGFGADEIETLQQTKTAESPARSGPWTDEQWEAIVDRGRDVLVSAAAGSGKTAVLTERVLRLVTEPDGDREPVALDSLLVITFTRKAAREMRERIEKKIRERIRDNQEDSIARAAADALPRATIKTFDAFCDRLVRQHFHRAQVSPNVRLSDENETAEIAQQAAREIFEELIDPENETELAGDFARLISATPPAAGRGNLEELAARVHAVRGYIASLAEPERWIAETREALDRDREARSIDDLSRAEFIRSTFLDALQGLSELFDGLCECVREKEGEEALPEAWLPIATGLHGLHDTLVEEQSPLSVVFIKAAQWYTGVSEILSKLKNKKVCGEILYSDPVWNKALEKISDPFVKWHTAWYRLDPEHAAHAARLAGRDGAALLDLALAVEARVQRIQRHRGVISFQDVERLALNILRDPDGGPSSIAHACQEQFNYVLVDEFQDISPLQDAIISYVSRTRETNPPTERNLFIVGDVKQSIYRFRRADPMLFADRMTAWRDAHPAEKRRRINLKQNFRSRPGVLQAVNSAFENLMSDSLGGIDYDDDARLYEHRDVASPSPVGLELHCLARDEGGRSGGSGDGEEESALETLAGIEREAEFIARRVREMCDPKSGIIIQPEEGDERPMRPGDCAILVRRIASDLDTWIAALGRFGLSVAATGQDPLLSQVEIIELLNALRLADDPFQDVALAATMRSPLGGFDENELLRIRMTQRSGAFHRAIWTAAGRGETFACDGENQSEKTSEAEEVALSPALAEKLGGFMNRLDRWRELAIHRSAEDVLDALLYEDHYADYVAGISAADNRLKNIDALRRMIRDHGARLLGESDLTSFLRFIEGRDSFGSGKDESEDESEAGDAIRLMTVHKSKGLEFPVVFLPRIFSAINSPGRRGDLMLSEHGLDLPGVDIERRLRLHHPAFIAQREHERVQSRAEELRLLYVAMTRARERLIVLGAPGRSKRETIEAGWSFMLRTDDSVPPWVHRLNASRIADLLGPIYYGLSREAESPQWLHVEFHDPAPHEDDAVELESVRRALLPSNVDDDKLWFQAGEELREAFPEMEAPAPFDPWPPLLEESPDPGPLSRTPMKIVASSLHRDMDSGVWFCDPETVESDEAAFFDYAEGRPIGPGPLFRQGEDLAADAPEFMAAGGKLDAAARGSLAHRLLRHVDLRGDLSEAGLGAQARDLFERGLLGVEDTAALNVLPLDRIAWFFTTPLGQKMAGGPAGRTGHVLRELPFRRWFHAGDLHVRAADGAFSPIIESGRGQPVMVQGVIDCVIDEGGSAIVIDYKTDRVRDLAHIDELTNHYYAQIDAYRGALRSIWQVPVEEAWLVFLDARQCVQVEDVFE